MKTQIGLNSIFKICIREVFLSNELDFSYIKEHIVFAEEKLIILYRCTNTPMKLFFKSIKNIPSVDTNY